MLCTSHTLSAHPSSFPALWICLKASMHFRVSSLLILFLYTFLFLKMVITLHTRINATGTTRTCTPYTIKIFGNSFNLCYLTSKFLVIAMILSGYCPFLRAYETSKYEPWRVNDQNSQYCIHIIIMGLYYTLHEWVCIQNYIWHSVKCTVHLGRITATVHSRSR